MKEDIIKNNCPQCGNVDKYSKKQFENALDQEGEIVVRTLCSNCGYKSEIAYKQILGT